MAGQDLNRSIKIYIDGSEAAKGIEPVKKAIADLETKLGKLTGQEADYEEKSKQLKKQLESKNRALQNYEKKVQETDRILKNLSGATYQELLAVRKQIIKSLENEVRGTAQYNAALEQKRRVTEALTRASKEMRIEIGCQGTTFGKAANLVNQYAGLFTTTVASVTGLSMAMRSSVQAYADMEEAESNVRKYTGMTTEQVKELNEALQKMDTRTARDKLNALAGDAGRLGITAKEDVLDFVDAADKINVALGEDLGEDAVANIGKLAQMFGEDDRMGLRSAMLATGSAINEVAQNSSAAEAYLVEFTARVAGVAHQAGISQADILGFAASMDENMLRNEASATAYQNILLKMMTDTEKFAKVAGLNLQEFAKLVRTDANEALLTFASALQKRGGMADLAPLFGDLKTEGAGVASMLAVLAGKAEEVRSRQELANNAYQDGTSILKEFNVQNTTVQAGLDKAKKGFNEVSIQLGEKLLPLMSHMISSTSLLVRGMNVTVSVLYDHKGAVIGASIAYGTYLTAQKLNVAWTKLQVAWNNRSITSFKDLRKVMSKNIFGILLVGLGAYIGKLYDAKARQEELAGSLSGLKKVNHEVTKQFSEQEGRIRVLNGIIQDNAASLDLRKKALNELKGIVPGYNATLSDEGTLLNNNTEAIKAYLVQLEKQIKLKAAQEELEELYKKQRDLDKQERDESDTYWDIRQQNTLSGYDRNGFVAKVSRYFGTEKENNALKKLNETKQALQGVNQEIETLQQEIAQTSLTIDPVVTGHPVVNNDDSPVTPAGDATDQQAKLDALKAAIAAENELYAQQRIELKEAYINQTDEQLSSYELFKEAEEQLEMAHLQRTLEISGLDKDARIKIEEQLLDFKLKCQKEFEDAQKKGSLKQVKDQKKNTKELQAEYQKRFDAMKGHADAFGTAVGEVISGQKNALEALGDVMIDFLFDIVDDMITAKLTELAASAAAATAEGTMKEISSKGIAGIGTSALIAAAVSGLMMTAKTALKGLLGKRPSKNGGENSSSSGASGFTGHRVATGSVTQHAAGKYDVIGADDGQLYTGVPYIGTPTGIVSQPALISEQGGELIINTEDLRRLQQHINYPVVLEAIADARRGNIGTQIVAQHANGNYEPLDVKQTQPIELNTLLVRLSRAIETLTSDGVPASVVLSELERKQKQRNRSKAIGSKNGAS